MVKASTKASPKASPVTDEWSDDTETRHVRHKDNILELLEKSLFKDGIKSLTKNVTDAAGEVRDRILDYKGDHVYFKGTDGSESILRVKNIGVTHQQLSTLGGGKKPLTLKDATKFGFPYLIRVFAQFEQVFKAKDGSETVLFRSEWSQFTSIPAVVGGESCDTRDSPSSHLQHVPGSVIANGRGGPQPKAAPFTFRTISGIINCSMDKRTRIWRAEYRSQGHRVTPRRVT